MWLWALIDPERLPADIMTRLDDPDSTLLLSAASAWEIAIKYRLGKLALPQPPDVFVPERMQQTGTVALAAEHEHVLRVADLPDHHRDPFDRLLIAQAQSLSIPLISADRQLAAYDVELIPA